MPSADTPLEVWVLIVRAVRDALAVLEARGVPFRDEPDVAVFCLDDEAAAERLRDGLLGAPHFARVRAHSHFDTNPAEMRRVYWDVVETGEELGVEMPHLAALGARIPR